MKYIERDPKRMSGCWVFKNTRIPVSIIHYHLIEVGNYSLKKVKQLWPFLTVNQIKGGINEYRKIYYSSDYGIYYKHPNPFMTPPE